MTRTETLPAAIAAWRAYTAHDLDHMFGRRPDAPDRAACGYIHGWIAVGAYTYHPDELHIAVAGRPAELPPITD